jgi:heat shock protein 4
MMETNNVLLLQDWLYDEGDDASKGMYVAKMDELRSLAGPVVQRHFDKVEAERQAVQARIDAEQAAKRAAEEEKAAQEGSKDEEMTDADGANGDDEAGGSA